VDVYRNPAATDVQFVVDSSTNLLQWESSKIEVYPVTVPEHRGSVQVMTYETAPLSSDVKRQFVRIKIVQGESP